MMDLAELRKEPHLSASSVTGYLECGLAYRFGKVDGLAPEFTPDVLVFGSAIHEVLAEYYRSLAKGVRLAGELLKESFEKHWCERAADNDFIRYKEGTDYRRYMDQGKEMLVMFAAQVPVENCKVLAVEEPFSMKLDGLPVPLIGVYDLVIEDSSGVITIVDHKT
ncbi:MAG: PD-(D/E)XK nuclease family protein, partial [Deltaproteobacteria bacterium]|nr:PD-(D/E)XK nuclease family protein [Deltaproteobacteria bacterium]